MPDKFYNNPREFHYPKGTISLYTPILTVTEREKRFEELSDAAARLMYSVCQEQKAQSQNAVLDGSSDHLITKQKEAEGYESSKFSDRYAGYHTEYMESDS